MFRTVRFFLIAAAIAGPIVYLDLNWDAFPATVPTHFGPGGKPDGWGPRNTLIFVPAIAAVVVTALGVVRRFPTRFNYPVRITPENAALQQQIALRLLDWLQIEVASLLCYLSIQQMRTALGLASGLSPWFLAVVLPAIFGTITVYLWQAVRAK